MKQRKMVTNIQFKVKDTAIQQVVGSSLMDLTECISSIDALSDYNTIKASLSKFQRQQEMMRMNKDVMNEALEMSSDDDDEEEMSQAVRDLVKNELEKSATALTDMVCRLSLSFPLKILIF